MAMTSGSGWGCVFVVLYVFFLSECTGTTGVNLDSVINCYERTFNMYVTKPYRTPSGHVLACKDMVPVRSCWGRCDSSEVMLYICSSTLTRYAIARTFVGMKNGPFLKK